jgi:hypothetical protein
MHLLGLTKDERTFLTATCALQADSEGREVFTGLTREESEEYLAFWSNDDRPNSARENELYSRHEAARRQMVVRQDSSASSRT